MTALIAFDFTMAVVALFLIAFGVLRLGQQPVLARAVVTPKPAVFRRDIAYINVERRGGGVAFREAQAMGYKVTDRNGPWVTMRRNGG